MLRSTRCRSKLESLRVTSNASTALEMARSRSARLASETVPTTERSNGEWISSSFPSVIHFPPTKHPVGGASEATSGMNFFRFPWTWRDAFAENLPERRLNHVQALVKLFVTNDERHEQPDHVAISAGGDRDQAILVTVFHDLFGFALGGLAAFR